MKLNLELKDDFIKGFVDLYNQALELKDDELMNIYHRGMLLIVEELQFYCLDKILK